MKNKLDLNHLLAKYEGITVRSSPGYSPARGHDYRAEEFAESEVNQSRGYQQFQRETKVQAAPISSSFQMSRSQCEQYLLNVREQLKNEERNLEGYASEAHRHIHQRFQANHEKIKREILQLLDKAFRDNERYISEELKKQGSSEPLEFQSVHRQISTSHQEINRLLYGLKGQDFKRSIAETVLKDFNSEIIELKQVSKSAKQTYLRSLGEVEPDLTRIDCIRQDLQKLFRLSQRNARLVEKSFFQSVGGGRSSDNQAAAMIDNNNNRQDTNRLHQRKSFFNFGFQ